MSSILGAFNRLLPFATPGTPFLQDILHLAAICTLLYFAPQIQDHLQRRQQNRQTNLENPHQQHNQEQTDLANQDAAQDIDEPEDLAGNQQAEALPNNDVPRPDDHAHRFPDEDGNDNNHDGQPGPANPRDSTAQQRNVGAKKAKSLARRDQRRAYHEFQRSQGEAQRARDAEGAEEREKAQVAERERRKAAEAALEAKKAREREARREQERKEREEEQARRELAVAVVRRELEARRMCNLFDVAAQVGGDADEVWLEKILAASGLLKRDQDSITMVTSTGWVVRVGAGDMARVYSGAVEADLQGTDGMIRYEALGPLVESVIRKP